VFIGPNNVGKSYVATAIHALRTGLAEGVQQMQFGRIKEILAEVGRSRRVSFKEIESMNVRDIQKIWSLCADRVKMRLEHSFGARIDEIINVDAANLRIEINGRLLKGIMEFYRDGEVRSDCKTIMRKGQKKISLSRFVVEPIPSFFLPAARSGILQAHKVIAAVITELSPLMPIRGIEVPKLSGVVASFIYDLLMVTEHRSPGVFRFLMLHRSWLHRPFKPEEFDERLKAVLSFMENHILKGTIIPKAPIEKLAPDFFYRSLDGRIEVPVYRASSMVSELAPLYIYLKYVLPVPSFLIIEEPESHLHPKAQALIARLLVKLVRAGVHILITTHSDYILSQLSNHIALAGLAPDEVRRMGYEDDEQLKPSEVGVYLFRFDGKWAVTERLRVTEEGIPDDELIRVAEEIYGIYTKIHYYKQLKKMPR